MARRFGPQRAAEGGGVDYGGHGTRSRNFARTLHFRSGIGTDLAVRTEEAVVLRVSPTTVLLFIARLLSTLKGRWRDGGDTFPASCWCSDWPRGLIEPIYRDPPALLVISRVWIPIFGNSTNPLRHPADVPSWQGGEDQARIAIEIRKTVLYGGTTTTDVPAMQKLNMVPEWEPF